MKGCCKEFKEFDSKYGGGKTVTMSLKRGGENRIEYWRDIWNFKYCPFCRREFKKKGGKIAKQKG